MKKNNKRFSFFSLHYLKVIWKVIYREICSAEWSQNICLGINWFQKKNPEIGNEITTVVNRSDQKSKSKRKWICLRFKKKSTLLCFELSWFQIMNNSTMNSQSQNCKKWREKNLWKWLKKASLKHNVFWQILLSYRQHPRSKSARKMESVSRSLCVQNLKVPLKLSSFARETDLIFLSFFDVGCCLYQEQIYKRS